MFNPNDYEMVEERLKKWWADNPDGRIYTELLEATPTRFIVQASLYRTEADPKPVATGLAQTNIGTNKQTQDYGLELAETSSIGRALSNYIYSGKKRASREEMIKIEKADDPWTIQEKPMPKPAVEDMVKTAFSDAEAVPTCKHGSMHLKEGTKNNRQYHGYICSNSGAITDVCEAIWYELSPSGKWRPKAKK